MGPSHLGLRTIALENFAKKETQIKATAVQATTPVKNWDPCSQNQAQLNTTAKQLRLYTPIARVQTPVLVPDGCYFPSPLHPHLQNRDNDSCLWRLFSDLVRHCRGAQWEAVCLRGTQANSVSPRAIASLWALTAFGTAVFKLGYTGSWFGDRERLMKIHSQTLSFPTDPPKLDLPATGATGKFSSPSSLVLFHSSPPPSKKGFPHPESYYDVSWSTNFQSGGRK